MSAAPGYIKGGCTSCSGHIEFPAEALGAAVPCPHCGKQTALLDNLKPAGSVQLRVPTPAPPAPQPAARPQPASVTPPPPAASGPRPTPTVQAQRAVSSAPPASAAGTPKAKPTPAEKPAPKVSMECPTCGLEISIKAEACPGCGMVLKERQAFPWKFVGFGIAGLALVLFLSGGVIFKKKQPAWMAAVTKAITGLGKKQGAGETADPGDTKMAENATPATPAAVKADEKKAPEKKKGVLSGRFELLNQDIERTPGRSLVYVVGTVTNGTAKQAFSVRITFDLFNRKGETVGNATDYVQVIESGDGWNFRALILDTNAATAKLQTLEKEKDTP